MSEGAGSFAWDDAHAAGLGRTAPRSQTAELRHRGGRRPGARGIGLISRTSVEARWVWCAVVGFVAVSGWWVSVDDRVPDWDSGIHEILAGVVHGELAKGHLSAPFTDYNTYPPLVHLVGGLSAFVVGTHPAALILSANVVFVPLLAFGCFGAASVAYGRRAGLLTAALALGSPIVVSTMHEYWLDTPQTALIAVTVWALLASRHFERIGISAVAGVLAGLALLTKETSVVFLAGIVLVSVVRGGPTCSRGMLAFALGSCLVAGPWYIDHASQLGSTFSLIGGLTPPQRSPPRLSWASFAWYGWNFVNEQALAPFAVAFLVGAALALRRIVRGGVAATNVEPELLAGAFVSYLLMTLLVHKDPRYTLPMLVYVAALATGWIATLERRRWRASLSAAVVALAALSFVGVSTGLGGAVRIALPGAKQTIIDENQLTLYETTGWVRGGPVHDADVQALLTGLRAAGIRDLLLRTGSDPVDFNRDGLSAMALADGLHVNDAGAFPDDQRATLVRSTRAPGAPPPCLRMNDGSSIYVVVGDVTELDPSLMRDPRGPTRRFTFLCPGRTSVAYP